MNYCKHCHQEIPKFASTCPFCGKKQEVWYKRISTWVFIILALIIAYDIYQSYVEMAPVEEPSSYTTSTEIEDTDISTLTDAFMLDYYNAKKYYTNRNIRITAPILVFNSAGRYITINKDVNINCNIVNQEQMNILNQKTIGENITICGTIIFVDDALGYSIEVQSIE